ncbi:MAG: hypothetical protein HY902_18310 [Deltaproteobacteria bacterium]|nr:hypothetical protein [Deltaproteobacteria bacterium]
MRTLTVLAALALALGLSACDSGTSSSNTATTADTSSGTDTSTGSDTSTSSDTTAQDTTAAKSTWVDVKDIFAAKCATAGCHDPNTTEKGYNATVCTSMTATKVKSNVSAGIMPPKGSPTLTADEKAKIAQWFADGTTCP